MDHALKEPSDSREGGDLSPSDATHQSVIAFHGPRNLPQLAKAINLKHATVQAHLRAGAAEAFEAGELLIEAKKTVRGTQEKWLPWLKRNCALSERTAQAYMRLARLVRANPENSAAVLSGSFTKALRSLPLAGKSATVADSEDDDDDAEVAEAIDATPAPSIAARIASDAEKVVAVCNYVWHLGTALQRAPPPSNWHLDPLDREHLQRFAADIIARLTAAIQELGLKDGGK
jgi:hypothetical protein